MNAPPIDGPEIRLRKVDGLELATRFWRLAEPMLAVTSAPLGGGLGLRHWVCNVQVRSGYECDNPQNELTLLAAEAGLSGPGAGMMTAVDVRTASILFQEGIAVDVTVGVSRPLWAAGDETEASTTPGVGTINTVVILPERLSDGALVNAVGTATEAKTQALWAAGVRGTGTATDALCILCPSFGPAHPYGGPRSTWGSRLARAVHGAVLAGCPPIGRT